MSNLAVKLPQRQPQQPKRQDDHRRTTDQSVNNQPHRARRPLFTGFELSIIVMFFASLIVFGFMFITNSYHLYKENRQLEETKAKVSAQKVENKDLQTEVERLSTYERIMSKAKELGLKIDPNNIKVINK
ncbi:MAG: cell division protein FtsL [Bacillaceae bacterium]